MGRAVELDPKRQIRSRSALVLGGGGFTGGVYEIGALRAIDLLSVNGTVNDFDIYVGTSAGAIVAAGLANGITPEEMMRVAVEQQPTLPSARPGALLRPNYLDYLLRGIELPWRIATIAGGLVRGFGKITAVDVVAGLAQSLPSGLYSTGGIERYVRDALSADGRTNDFRLLKRELFIAATDLDTGERIVLGSDGWDDVPISTAVAASSALPMIYKPAEIRGRELVDGGVMSTTNLDLAVEAGARFIVVVNPLVPYTNDFQHRVRRLSGTRPRRVSDMGFPHIGYQAFKMLAYHRLHELARSWEQRSPTRVRRVISHFEADQEQASAWRKILEQTTSTLLRQSAQQ